MQRKGKRQLAARVASAVPSSWLSESVYEHSDTGAALTHRRRVVAAVTVAGTGLLGVSLSTEPDSPRFYGLTGLVAATWAAGGIASGPLHLGYRLGRPLHRPILTPVLSGIGAFGVFYGSGLVAREIPVLNTALTRILRYAHQGSARSVLLTTLANGAAEEVFFRGALYAAAADHHPIRTSSAAYALTTTATRNPALVLASIVMGTLFGLQRRLTGGIQAPLLTHLVWSTLMVRYLPPLFGDNQQSSAALKEQRWSTSNEH